MKINFFKKENIKSKLLELDEVFTAADNCRKCGKCQSVCPVFRQTGLEQHTARGKLALLNGLKNDFNFDPALIENHLRFCVLCGRCAEACPSGIDTLSVFLKARAVMHELDKKSFLKKFLIKIFIKFPFLFKILKKNTKSDQNISKTKKETKKIIFFTGCLFDRVFQDTTENAINLFKSFGFETEVVSGQCCGLPLLSSGDEKGFKFSLEKLYEKFINIDSGVIVSGCPTCISTLKKIWPDFSNYGKELNLKFEIYDFHQFAAKIIKEKNLEFINDNNLKLKWHLPCHAKSLGAEKDCDYVLEKCFGMKPENNSRLNSCCGFGGTFSIDHPKISKKILEVRSMEIMLENEEILLTGCPACILQLERIKGYKNRVFHTIDAISSQLLAKK